MKWETMKWEILYKILVKALVRCQQSEMPELKQVENAFMIAFDYWRTIRKELKGHNFTNDADEINFYKNVKPKFTCFIEYFILVNNSLVFVPQEDKEIEKLYWEKELERLQRFIEKNASFVAYYKRGGTERDWQYFLPKNYDLAEYTVSKIYEPDGDYMTSHDHLVAALLAQEMYHEYVKKILRRFD